MAEAQNNQTQDAAADDPNAKGCCQYFDQAGQQHCIDNVTKAQCAKFPNSMFIPGGSCQ
jgi:hypothetical protein